MRKWLETYDKKNREFMVACEEFQKQGGDETSASCPVFPLKPLPETTDFCTPKSLCYHREYKTNDTSESKCLSIPIIKDSIVINIVCYQITKMYL